MALYDPNNYQKLRMNMEDLLNLNVGLKVVNRDRPNKALTLHISPCLVILKDKLSLL